MPQSISEDIVKFVLSWLLTLTPPTTKTAGSHSLSLDSERLIGLVCTLSKLAMVAVVIAKVAVMSQPNLTISDNAYVESIFIISL